VAENKELTAENEELTAENEELTAANEELTAANEELTAENEMLTVENEELAGELAEQNKAAENEEPEEQEEEKELSAVENKKTTTKRSSAKKQAAYRAMAMLKSNKPCQPFFLLKLAEDLENYAASIKRVHYKQDLLHAATGARARAETLKTAQKTVKEVNAHTSRCHTETKQQLTTVGNELKAQIRRAVQTILGEVKKRKHSEEEEPEGWTEAVAVTVEKKQKGPSLQKL
jgi:hypothetical protein